MDGALLVDLRDADPRVPSLAALKLPAVALGPPEAAGMFPAAWSDDGASVQETVRYLAALGHRRIARVTGLARLADRAARDAAFDGACHDAGLPRPTVVHTDHTGEEGARATRKLLIASERPTAVV